MIKIEVKERLDKSDAVSKQAYSAPKFTHYGSVSKLTLAGAFGGNDGNTVCTGNAGGNPECGS